MKRIAQFLIAVLVIAAALAAASSIGAQERQGIFGERDTVNHVICYRTRISSDYLSCVYVPPDGTSVNYQFPPSQRLPEMDGPITGKT